MSDVLANLKEVVSHLEFSLKVRTALTSVRLIDESDGETFERVMRLARKMICPECRGYRRQMVTGNVCADCGGTGERQPPCES